MKRLFITTNIGQVLGMYNIHNGYETENAKATIEFANLPKEYELDNELKVIILKDDNTTNWNGHTINSQNDYLLYHTSSKAEVISAIPKDSFKSVKSDSHGIGKPHDRVFQIIFEDNGHDKAKRILEELDFTDEEINRKNELEANIRLYKALKILPLKGNWDESSFHKAITKIKTFTGMSLVEDKLSGIVFIQDFDEYYKQLDVIKAQIINLSTVR